MPPKKPAPASGSETPEGQTPDGPEAELRAEIQRHAELLAETAPRANNATPDEMLRMLYFRHWPPEHCDEATLRHVLFEACYLFVATLEGFPLRLALITLPKAAPPGHDQRRRPKINIPPAEMPEGHAVPTTRQMAEKAAERIPGRKSGHLSVVTELATANTV